MNLFISKDGKKLESWWKSILRRPMAHHSNSKTQSINDYLSEHFNAEFHSHAMLEHSFIHFENEEDVTAFLLKHK